MYLFNRRCHNRAEVDDCYCYCCPIFLPKSMDANGYAFVLFVVRVEEAIDVLCTDWSVRSLSLFLSSLIRFFLLFYSFILCVRIRLVDVNEEDDDDDGGIFASSLSLSLSLLLHTSRGKRGREKKNYIWGRR